MRAFKCDRCGALYEDYLNRKSDEIYNITTNPNMTCCCLDLCKTCSDKLQKWVNGFDNDEISYTPEEVVYALVKEGQENSKKYGFKLGDIIKFSPSEVERILKSESEE